MSHSEQAPRRAWPWVVVVIVAVVAIVVGASVASNLLAGQKPTSTGAAPTASTATPTASPSATQAPSGTPTADSPTFDDDDVTAIQTAVDSDDMTGLYDYLADPVHVRFAASDFDADRSPDNAINDLDYIQGSSDWNWSLDAPTLASFRAGTYADQFPEGAIIGQSAEGYVISFTIAGTSVSNVFVSKSATLVAAPAQ